MLRTARDEDGEQLIKLITEIYSEYPNCFLDVQNEVLELKQIYSYFLRHQGNFWGFT